MKQFVRSSFISIWIPILDKLWIRKQYPSENHTVKRVRKKSIMLLATISYYRICFAAGNGRMIKFFKNIISVRIFEYPVILIITFKNPWWQKAFKFNPTLWWKYRKFPAFSWLLCSPLPACMDTISEHIFISLELKQQSVSLWLHPRIVSSGGR